MEILTETVGLFEENTYLLVDEASRETVIVDPGDEASRLLDIVSQRDLKVRCIVATHGHLDHVGAVAELRRQTGAPFHIHADDVALLEHLPAQAGLFGVSSPPVPQVDGHLVHGQTLSFGDPPAVLRVAATPGHSPGGVCFHGDGKVFVGDLVFQGSIGRTDLPGGDLQALLDSVRREILSLADETRLYPGHGPVTTVGRERKQNPFLQEFLEQRIPDGDYDPLGRGKKSERDPLP